MTSIVDRAVTIPLDLEEISITDGDRRLIALQAAAPAEAEQHIRCYRLTSERWPGRTVKVAGLAYPPEMLDDPRFPPSPCILSGPMEAPTAALQLLWRCAVDDRSGLFIAHSIDFLTGNQHPIHQGGQIDHTTYRDDTTRLPALLDAFEAMPLTRRGPGRPLRDEMPGRLDAEIEIVRRGEAIYRRNRGILSYDRIALTYLKLPPSTYKKMRRRHPEARRPD